MTKKTDSGKVRNMKCGILYRDVRVEESAIDEEKRTVSVAFSSETPVERYFGNEILDHNPKSVRLGRLKDKGPVLVDHDRRDHVGVVEKVSIDDDRTGRATLRFGNSVRATEIFQDVVDGIRNSISVGYRVHEFSEKPKSNEVRVTDWEPHEISMVSIPADVAAGVGRDEGSEENDVVVRSLEPDEPKPKPTERKIMPEERTPEQIEEDLKAARSEARKAEQTRIREITALGETHKLPELARTAIDDGTELEDFRTLALDAIEKKAPPTTAPTDTRKEAQRKLSEGANGIEFVRDVDSGEILNLRDVMPATMLGLSGRETNEYSLMRAIRAFVNQDWKDAGFERECSLAISDVLKRDPKGFFVPYEVQARPMDGSRAAPMDAGTVGEGGYLVGTDHLAGSFIEYLYNASVVMQAGATTLPGLVGNVEIPTQAGTTTFEWLAEDGAVSDSVVATGQVTLTPTTVAGAVSMTRRLMKQSSPAVEGMVMRDLVRGAALAIDNKAIEGDGTGNTPTGVINASGVNTQIVNPAGQPTWAELVGFETNTDTSNALEGTLSYITTAAVVGFLKTNVKDASGAGGFMMNDVTGEANGYPTRRTNHLTAGTIVFGNWADLLIGMWGVLDVMPDPYRDAAKGGLVLRVFQDLDIAVRHGVSFCKNVLV